MKSSRISFFAFGVWLESEKVKRIVISLVKVVSMQFEFALGLTVEEGESWLDAALAVEKELKGGQG